ncbi:MAG: DNA mismatch repair protein MutL, partial [Firmicutes bacterium]|nr:DNA mismatch repair protein MutL [Bacillota bacterium]
FGEMFTADSFLEILDIMAEERLDSIYDTKELAIATEACKAAVKAHDDLSEMEAKELINRLLKLENPFSCPHGRPTMIKMSRYELERKFKRIQ